MGNWYKVLQEHVQVKQQANTEQNVQKEPLLRFYCNLILQKFMSKRIIKAQRVSERLHERNIIRVDKDIRVIKLRRDPGHLQQIPQSIHRRVRTAKIVTKPLQLSQPKIPQRSVQRIPPLLRKSLWHYWNYRPQTTRWREKWHQHHRGRILLKNWLAYDRGTVYLVWERRLYLWGK